MANLSYKRGKFEVRIPVGTPSTWLPAVVAILCLLMFAIAVVVLFTVGADPKTGPASLPTSIAAQGYQGLQRLLIARGHATATNRFEDAKSGQGGEITRGDIEIITLNDDGGTFNVAAQQRRARREMRDAQARLSGNGSASASASSDSSSSAGVDYDAPEYDYYYEAPDKKRADHVLYHPIGKVVIVVAPKWSAGGFARKNPRWAAEARLIGDEPLRRTLAFLSPVTERVSPNARADEDYDENTSTSASDSSASDLADDWIDTEAPAGKGVYDDGETLTTYDAVPFEITHTPARADVKVRGDLLAAPLSIGRVSDLQSIKGPNLTPLLIGPNGEALVSRVTVTEGRAQTKVPVYLISDPDLLNNQIFADPKKVIAALEIIERLSPPVKTKTRPSVVFNLTYNNMAFDHDLLHALSRPPYIGIPLSLLVFGLGLMWAAFARFGPPKLVEEGAALGRGVQVLADNAARLMAIAVKEAKLGPAYATMIRDEVLRNRGHRLTNPNESLDDLAERIGHLYGATDSYIGLKTQAATLLTVHQLIDLTKKLHAWKTEIDRANI